MSETHSAGTSALIAVIDQTWLKEVADVLRNAASELATDVIQADIACQLEAGRDVAYTALNIANGSKGR